LINRKPISIDSTILNASVYLREYKIAAFDSVFSRMDDISIVQNEKHEEMNVIKVCCNTRRNNDNQHTLHKDLINRNIEKDRLERQYWARLTFLNEDICVLYLDVRKEL
jgi:hypothetical protein